MSHEEFLNQIVDDFQYMYWAMVKRKPAGETLPFGQKAALMTIFKDAPLNTKRLSEAMHITSGAATQLVDALVEAGLAERLTDASDRRSMAILLTKSGKKAALRIERNRLSLLSELFNGVEEADLIAFTRVMQNVRQNINKTEGEK